MVASPEADATRIRALYSGAQPRRDDAPPSVLVVDDDAPVRRLVELVLARDGLEVTTAEGGREAIALGRARHFDALVLDVQMPDLDGWAVLHTLRDPAMGSRAAARRDRHERARRGVRSTRAWRLHAVA